MEKIGVIATVEDADSYFSTMKKINATVDNFAQSGGAAGSSFDKGFGDVVTGALHRVGAIMVDFGAQAAKAVGSFAKDSISAAGDFQQEFAQFQIAVGHTIDGTGLKLNDFKDLFISLGKELPVSTAEVEQAAVEMAKGGIDPATIAAGGLKQTIQFAAAALKGDLVSAAQISAKTMAAWTDITDSAATKTDFLTHAQNLMTQATTAASTTVDQLFLGLSNVGGTARLAGVSFDETVKALAQLTPSFASSADAGTSFKTFLARLQPTTKPAIAAMQDLGLYSEKTGSAFYDAQGNFVGMAKAEALLQGATANLSDAQREQALQTIFGSDAIRAAGVFAVQGQAGYDAMSDSIAKQTTLQDAAAISQNTYNTAVENAKGSVEALQITIGTGLLPVLTELMNDVIAPAVNTITTMADAIGGNDDAFNQLAPTLQSIVSTLDILIADTQEIIGAFNESGAASADFAQRIGALASDLGLPGSFITNIVEATQDLIASFSDGGDAAQQLGGVVHDLNGIWETALKTITDVGNGYLAIAQAVLPVVTTFWTDHGAEITAFAKTTYDSLIQIATTALQLYDSIVPPYLQSIAQYFTQHATGIESVLSGAWHIIEGIVTGGLALIEGAITVALDAIHGDWGKAWTDLQDMSATFVASIGTTIKGGLEIIAGLFDTSLADIGAVWQHNWDTLVEIATKVSAKMVTAGKSMIEGIIKGIEDEAGALYQALIDMGAHAFDKFMQGIKGGSPALVFVPGGQSVVQGIMLGMQTMLPSLIGVVDGVGIALKGQFKKVTDDVADQIDSAVKGMENQVRQAQKALSDLTVSGFTSGADINRTVADNLGKFQENVKPGDEQTVASQLKAAEQAARAMQDPSQGAKYFKQQSDQIFELAALRKNAAEQQQAILDNGDKQAETASKMDERRAQLAADIAEQQSQLAVAGTQAETDAIYKKIDALNAEAQAQLATLNAQADAQMAARHAAQLNLDTIQQQAQYIQQAQSGENSAAGIERAAAANPYTELTNQIRDILNTSITAGGKTQEMPPVLDDSLRALNGLLNQLSTTYAPVQQTSQAQYTNTYYGNSYNLGVQTNQSPAVVQQSFAILGAQNP